MDDTTLFVYGRSLRFIHAKMQRDLDNLYIWLCTNSLKLNVAKTKVMVFNVEGLTPNIALHIEGQYIENVTSFNFLGITLDHQLHFEKHYFSVYRKLVQSHFLIKKLSSILPHSCLRTLYFAYFHSHLAYCLPVWYPLLKKSSQNSMYVIQKRIIRTMSGASPRDHCMPLFKKESILTLQGQALLDNCKLMYRINENTCPVSLLNMFKLGVNHQTMRTRSHSINLQVHKTAMYNNSFLCKAIMDWSKLCTELKLLENRCLFAKKLKTKLLMKY